MEMRRDEREVKTIEEIFDILKRCDTCRLGLNSEGEAPYVIPMTFGCTLENGVITVYFHSAPAGRKREILKKDPHVCVEADLYYQVKHTEGGGITACYESVIGTGVAEQIEDKEGKVAAFKIMLEHYKESGFPASSCKGLPNCDVFKVVLTEVAGKHNL